MSHITSHLCKYGTNTAPVVETGLRDLVNIFSSAYACAGHFGPRKLLLEGGAGEFAGQLYLPTTTHG